VGTYVSLAFTRAVPRRPGALRRRAYGYESKNCLRPLWFALVPPTVPLRAGRAFVGYVVPAADAAARLDALEPVLHGPGLPAAVGEAVDELRACLAATSTGAVVLDATQWADVDRTARDEVRAWPGRWEEARVAGASLAAWRDLLEGDDRVLELLGPWSREPHATGAWQPTRVLREHAERAAFMAWMVRGWVLRDASGDVVRSTDERHCRDADAAYRAWAARDPERATPHFVVFRRAHAGAPGVPTTLPDLPDTPIAHVHLALAAEEAARRAHEVNAYVGRHADGSGAASVAMPAETRAAFAAAAAAWRAVSDILARPDAAAAVARRELVCELVPDPMPPHLAAAVRGALCARIAGDPADSVPAPPPFDADAEGIDAPWPSAVAVGTVRALLACCAGTPNAVDAITTISATQDPREQRYFDAEPPGRVRRSALEMRAWYARASAVAAVVRVAEGTSATARVTPDDLRKVVQRARAASLDTRLDADPLIDLLGAALPALCPTTA
jgi:hypothetical protein